MGTAFNPGLIVKKEIAIKKIRRLPIKGEVLVKNGDRVEYNTIVARALLPGDLHTIKLNERLNLEPFEVEETLKIKKGDKLKKGDCISDMKTFFGLFSSKYNAPFDGEVEYFSPITGHIGVRKPPVPVEINAYISGSVVDITSNEAATIMTNASLIQGIFGVGGEQQGTIKIIAKSPEQELTENDIPDNVSNLILVGGSLVNSGFLKKAAESGAKGVIVGGIIDYDLSDYLGYEIGVAVTGHENIPLTIIITEGFGKIPMAKRTFELLNSLEGKLASINGTTQIRAGALRPEIIIPLKETIKKEVVGSLDEAHKLEIGTTIRLIRVPYFGILAKVKSLPPNPMVIDTESAVRVLEAELPDGKVVTIPRANVEIIKQET